MIRRALPCLTPWNLTVLAQVRWSILLLGVDRKEILTKLTVASSKAVISFTYNETQTEDHVLDPAAREIYDSMEIQNEQFDTQGAAVTLIEPRNERNAG